MVEGRDKRLPTRKVSEKGISIAEWKNEKNGKTFLMYTIQKQFKDKTGTWQTAKSYFVEDLAVISALIEQISEKVVEKDAEPSGKLDY